MVVVLNSTSLVKASLSQGLFHIQGLFQDSFYYTNNAHLI